jgi:mono/diheme cytochrome c family protein
LSTSYVNRADEDEVMNDEMHDRRFPRGAFVAVVLAGLCLLFASPGRSQEDNAGRALFVANGCYQCHGYEGQGGAALRIAPMSYPFAAFARLVRHPANEMPAYSPNVLDDESLRRIFAYLRSVPEPPPVADIPALRDR